jgi:hypothetical protein
MGTANIPSATDGDVIPATDHNSLRAAFIGDNVPRNASGDATANAGDCGTATYPYKRANITTGYLFAGMMMAFHDYNGLLNPGHGWMKCNGDIINETNYDAIHGAGSWDLYIISSALEGKYTPNTSDKYLVGATNTTQTGASALTFVGNSGHSVSTSNHTHTIPGHKHKWFESAASGTLSDITRASAGGPLSFSSTGSKSSGYGIAVINSGTVFQPGGDNSAYTYGSDTVLSAESGGGETIDIQPHSLEVEYWIRII